MTHKLYNQAHGKLTEAELAELAMLLVKAGYTVRKASEKKSEKSAVRVHYIEATDDAGM